MRMKTEMEMRVEVSIIGQYLLIYNLQIYIGNPCKIIVHHGSKLSWCGSNSTVCAT
jgi:hypothetical protein